MLSKKNFSSNVENKTSNRTFGIFFATIFFIAFLSIYFYYEILNLSLFFLSLSTFLIILSIFLPSSLRLPNLLWFKIGLFLGQIINPIIMFILFLTLFMPLGLTLKIFGYDPLRKKQKLSNLKSFWIVRSYKAESTDKQF